MTAQLHVQRRARPATRANTIGFILFGVGIFGSLLSLAFWSSWGGLGGAGARKGGRTTVIEH